MTERQRDRERERESEGEKWRLEGPIGSCFSVVWEPHFGASA